MAKPAAAAAKAAVDPDIEQVPESEADRIFNAEEAEHEDTASEEAMVEQIKEHIDATTEAMAGKKSKETDEDEDDDGTEPEPKTKVKAAPAAKKPDAKDEADKKARMQEIAKKGGKNVTQEEQVEIEDYILNRFKGKGKPEREVAKSYFFAEKIISKQGQALAAQKAEIEALQSHIALLKEKGLDTRDTEAALNNSYVKMGEIVNSKQDQANKPKQPVNPFMKTIDDRIAQHIQPIAIQEQRRAQLAEDARIIETLRETYTDYTELEPIIADVIRSKKVDLTSPTKIEDAYIYARGLKAHQDAVAAAARKADPTAEAARKRAAKAAAKEDAYVEAAGGAGDGEEASGDNGYQKSLDNAIKLGTVDAWADHYAKYYMHD